MKKNGIAAPFHYIPLHSSPAGLKYGRISGCLKNTGIISDTIARLPIFYSLTKEQTRKILKTSEKFLNGTI